MTNVQVELNIFHFELSSKPNLDIFDITVSIWENMTLKPYSFLMLS